jgi:hypothetical protein
MASTDQMRVIQTPLVREALPNRRWCRGDMV